MTRQDRFKIKKLYKRVGRVTNADRLFFKRRPDRKYRVRLAAQCEIETEETLTGAALFVPEGTRVFVAVRNLMPGARMRLFLRGIEGADTDLSEAMARAIYDGLATDKLRMIEEQMRTVVRS